MKKRPAWPLFAPFAALALGAGIWLAAGVMRPRTTHHGGGACTVCHLAASPQKIKITQAATEGLPCMQCFPDGLFPAANQDQPALDPYSIQCMGCHGDKAGLYEEKDAIVVASEQILSHGSLNHSIGRDYVTAAAFGGYRPFDTLPEKVRLPGGKVGCISCHEENGAPHGKLLTPIENSALCFECHDL